MTANRHAWLTGLILVITITAALAQFILPAPLPSDAPATEFSAERALEVLAKFATVPHFVNTPNHTISRDILVEELQAIGLDPELQITTGALPQYGVAGHVENILARLPGTNSTGAILLAAHYDTVPQSPGAGDNGAGVVVILETLRALLASGLPLDNDVIVLLTDAEEVGTLGAQAFATEHPWMSDVRVMLNIEGTLEGPTLIIQTSRDNGWFMREFVRAAPQPFTFSWITDVYGALPMLTDFGPFAEAGIAGANLFALDGGDRYHTPFDDLAHLSARSLQHHGTQTLAVLRRFAGLDLTTTHGPNAITFNILGPVVARYSQGVSFVLVLIATALLVATTLIGVRQETMTWKGLSASTGISLATVLGLTLIITLLWQALVALNPAFSVRSATGYQFRATDGLFLTAALALTVTGVSSITRWAYRKLTPSSLAQGAHIVFAQLMWLTTLIVPGVSYLFTWPLIFGLLAMMWRMQDEGNDEPGGITLIRRASVIIPVVLIITPAISLLYGALALNFLPVLVLLTALGLSILALPLREILPARALTWGVLGVAVVAVVAGLLIPPFDAAHPRPTKTTYLLNVGENTATWLTRPQDASPWETQFTTDSDIVAWDQVFAPYKGTVRRSPAPVAQLAGTEVQILADTVSESGERTLRLNLVPAQRAHRLVLAASPDTQVTSITVDGVDWFTPQRIAERVEGDWLTGAYYAPSADGVEVSIALTAESPAEFLIAEIVAQLPDSPEISIHARSESEMSVGDETFVVQKITCD